MTKHILIADDERQARLSLSLILKGAGYRVTAVEDGARALAALHSNETAGTPIDLLLTDIKMPEMDGVTLVRAVKTEGLDVPAIAMTGFGDKEAVVQLLKSGCKDYIEKPLDADDILGCIETVLREVEKPGHGAFRISRDLCTYKRHLDRLSAQFDSAVGAYHELVNIPAGSFALPFAWENRPLAELGGDVIGADSRPPFHDVLVADVAGHDLGASFHTILIKAFFEENARQQNDGPTLFHLLNHHLLDSGNPQRMITALFLRIDLDAMTAQATTAGHPPLIHLPAAGDRVRCLSTDEPALGMDETADFGVCPTDLRPGDRLFLYTDGVTGAARLDTSTGQMKKLTQTGLETMLLSRRHLCLTDTVTAVWREVLAFCDAKPDDDMLLAGIEIPDTI